MKNRLFNHTLIFGLIIGFAMVIFQIILYIFSLLNNNALGNVIFFLLVIGVFLSVRNYRDHIHGGYLNFGKAFPVAFYTCIFAGVVGSIYTYFQYKYISPQLMDELLTLAQERLINKGIPDNQVELQSAILEKIMTPTFLSVAYIFNIGFWGALLSLVIAAILKKDENPLHSPNPKNDI